MLLAQREYAEDLQRRQDATITPTPAPHIRREAHRVFPPQTLVATTTATLPVLPTSLLNKITRIGDPPAPSTITHFANPPSYTLTTITRDHNLTVNLPTRIAYVDPHWPQIGTIVSESEIPAAWRETFEMKALRQQYISLGAICGIFVVGVLSVLAVGWARRWWRGQCCWGGKGKGVGSGMDYYG